jgi:hypothetical protein
MYVQFIIEIQTNSSLTFLDVTVTKKPHGSFGHTMYEKPTHMDVYFQATAPLSVNKACSHDYLF